MGLENMRRWPMYIVFAVCILLTLSLFNSWTLENELQNRIAELRTQLTECSRQQTTCMEESLRYQQQIDTYNTKVVDLEGNKKQLASDMREYKIKLMKSETQANRTYVDLEICKTELQSLKNLQLSKAATLETLRLEKATLTSQLDERKQKIEELEKEVTRLKSALTTKSAPNPPAPSKMTPAAEPPRLSPPLNNIPMNEPLGPENDAKEDIDEPSAMNDGPDFE
ncbi:uncharacterized protein LOC121726474 [Aricia agestis]|uniref:uncharacterized protein LOC121726474 n=1 Tax=Aricia agestis TaxID=91739 RepID=UPI001C20315F|nr:uncharacterized protein LOC121726474 [Aricia agestis]